MDSRDIQLKDISNITSNAHCEYAQCAGGQRRRFYEKSYGATGKKIGGRAAITSDRSTNRYVKYTKI